MNRQSATYQEAVDAFAAILVFCSRVVIVISIARLMGVDI